MANDRWRDDDRQRSDRDRDRYWREGSVRQDFGGRESGRSDYGRRDFGRQDYGRDDQMRRDYGRDWNRDDYSRGYRGSSYGRNEPYGRDYSRGENYGRRDYGSGGGSYSGYGYGGYGSSNYSEPSRDRDWGSSSGGADYRSEWDYDRDRYGSGYRGYGYQDYGAGSAWSAGLAEWPAPIADWRAGYREDWRRAQDDYRGGRDRDWRGDRGWGARGSDRGWWDRTKDEFRSWMGDEEAERRRRMDMERNEQRRGHYGRGPKGYARSDQRILEDVSDRLTDDWSVDASEIEVAVVAGEVTLTGTVDSREAKRRAENIAADVTGVKDVQNNLRVRQQTVGTNLTGSSSAALEQTTGLSSSSTSSTTPQKH